MSTALELIPKNKHDFQRLEELLKLDPEMVSPHFGALLQWLEDINWPIAQPISEYLVQRGKAMVPFVQAALKGSDRIWQYNILVYIVDKWPPDVVTVIQSDLENLANHSILEADEVDIVALGLLVKHNLSDRELLQRLLQFKLSGVRAILSELLVIEKIMEDRATHSF